MRQQLVLGYIRAKYKFLTWLSPKKAARKAFELFCTPQFRNRKQLPPIFEKAERVSFSFEGYNIRGYRWNHPMDKKILILHGFESSVINFDRYVRPLIKAGYEVLAFDAPAHGRSSGKQITVVTYKNFVLHICKEYGPVKNFIAHSFGGLALSMAMEELPNDEETKIVMIAPATESTTAIDSFFSILQLNGVVRKEFDHIIETLGGQKPEWFSIKRVAENLRARVLWLHDKDDHMTPLSDVEPVMKKNYPNFRFVISEGLGHRRIYRDNNSLREVLKFFDAYKEPTELQKKAE